MSDETMAGAADAARPAEPVAPPPGGANLPPAGGPSAPVGEPRTEGSSSEAAGTEATGTEGARREGNGSAPAGAGSPEGAPRKRRRRGSRGGRNRKRPANPQGGAPAGAEVATTSGGGAPPPARHAREPEDEHDEGADRGLTTDDVAVTALEDAGLRPPAIGDTRPAPEPEPGARPARPQIGDTRPAPVAAPGGGEPGGSETATAAPKRRRRRGGRGRGRGSGAAGAGNGTGGTGGTGGAVRGVVVTADLGLDDEDLDDLDPETLERRRGRTRKGRPTGRYTMVVHVAENGAIQMGVLEGRVLVEHYVSRPQDAATSIDGNIYLGKVQNVLPGMEAAFVDIGTPKNGVLYRGDVAYDESEVDEQQPRIERLLKNGQPVLVQVTKNPIAHKGARLTQEVSLAGRFVVMVPGQPQTYGISKRLPDDERKRLRKILEGLRPADAGLIVRTAAEGATAEELERDLRRLRNQWEQISQLAARGKPAKLLYQEPPLVVRVIREEFTKEYRAIVIDDRALYEEVRAYVEAIAPELAERVEYYEDPQLPVFERFHVHEQLHKALDRKVWLPSGGSLVIERTEALTVIDVNTGKNVGKSNLEETVFQNNLEAADEVARQLRLRDIGGIIVIDFIDMEIKANRDKVVGAFRDALARDKTRTQVFDISELGLVEMTRKRVSEGLVEAFSQTCPTCEGRGFLLNQDML